MLSAASSRRCHFHLSATGASRRGCPGSLTISRTVKRRANLQNRALFLRISKAIRSVLADTQAEALGSDAPGWLYDLLSVLHVRCATVLVP